MATLEVRRLTKRYRRVPVVNDVSFAVHSSEVTGYLGPNGSGKSTTVKMLTGLVEPSNGQILLDGIDIRRDLIAYKRLLGYVPEEAHVYPSLTGLEYLQLMGRLRELPEHVVYEKASDLLQLFNLHLHRHSPLASYSKGMKQRVLISSAVLHDPQILIFDEPLSGLDVSSALLFKHLVAELASSGKIILYISHVLEVVEKICKKVIVIYRGQIKAEDSVEGLRDLMHLPSLEEIFTQLVQHEDMEAVAKDIADAIRRTRPLVGAGDAFPDAVQPLFRAILRQGRTIGGCRRTNW
jgi:ABC-2 type transport system ATP-binding protein